MTNEERADLFEKMTQLSKDDQTFLLARLFGQFEAYAEEGVLLEPDLFFKAIEKRMEGLS